MSYVKLSNQSQTKPFCTFCKMTFSTKYIYETHLQTKRHKKASRIIYECDTCNGKFMVKATFYKHKKSCKDKLLKKEIFSELKEENNELKEVNEELKEENEELKEKITEQTIFQLKEKIEMEKKEREIERKSNEKILNQLKKENLTLKKQNKIMQEENDFHKKIIMEVGNINEPAVSSYKYICKTYTNAPPLLPINLNILKLNENNETNAKFIIREFNNERLAQSIGKCIILEYKKDDPNVQSLWGTDTSRLSYVIREIINKETEWKMDKKGARVKSLIIDPIAEYIIECMREYIKNNEKKIKNGKTARTFLEKTKNATNVMDYVSKKLANDVNKFISSYFYLDKQEIPKYIEQL